MPETTKGRDAALAALKKRRANPPKKIDNGSLPAGSPMYYYCISCDHLAATMPESHWTSPPRLCGECQALKNMGWLD